MATKEYKIGAFTYMLNEQDAKRLDAVPVEPVEHKSAPTPDNKSRKPRTKKASDAAADTSSK